MNPDPATNPAPETPTPLTDAAKVDAGWIIASHSPRDYVDAEECANIEKALEKAKYDRDVTRGMLLVSRKQCDALTAENERLKAERQWQLISTAPKDGTRIIVWETSQHRPEIASWSKWRNAWIQSGQDWIRPTHWMPLRSDLDAEAQIAHQRANAKPPPTVPQANRTATPAARTQEGQG